MTEDSHGTLWVATNSAGLSHVTPDGGSPTLVPLPPGSSLPTTIFGILEDANGNLWLSSRTGVDRVAIAALTAFAGNPSHPPAITHYGAADGMRISEASGGGHPAAWRAHDGALWFATLNGAAAAHPESAVRNTIPPLVSVEQILVDGAAAAVQPGEAIPRRPWPRPPHPPVCRPQLRRTREGPLPLPAGRLRPALD